MRKTPPSKPPVLPPPLLGEANWFIENLLGAPNRARLSPAGRDVAAGDREGCGGTALCAVPVG